MTAAARRLLGAALLAATLVAGMVGVSPALASGERPSLSVPGLRALPSVAAGSCPSTESALQALINGGGTVTLFCPTATTIPFTSTINIDDDVTLDASDSPGKITFDGGGSVQLFFVAQANFTLKGLTLAHGHSDAGGAINNDEFGTVTISNSTLSGNSSSGNFAGDGGAIANENGTLIVSSSTFSGNSGSEGGAIDNDGTASITNSTFSGNSAEFAGGAISNEGQAVTIANSTFSGNSTANEGGAISNNTTAGTVSIGGSIVAANSGGNCAGGQAGINDKGYNLEDGPRASCGFSPSSHDIIGQNPLLGPLEDNGGPTQTMALLAGSPAIDQIPLAGGLCPATDQRGAPRPGGSQRACDIGAYESGASQLQDVPSPVKPITCKTLTKTVVGGRRHSLAGERGRVQGQARLRQARAARCRPRPRDAPPRPPAADDHARRGVTQGMPEPRARRPR